MVEPIFSFIGPSIRPQNWERIYNNLSEGNTVPFEIIFAGPYSSEGIYKLPENFKFIKTNVKPSQCIEIAARNAEGKYVSVISDDMVFEKKFINNVCRWMNKMYSENMILSCRYACLWDYVYNSGSYEIIPIDDALTLDNKMEDSPVIGICSFFNKEIWHKLGGIDKRFHSSFCEVDMILRFYEHGFHPFLIPDCIVIEVKNYVLRDNVECNLFSQTGVSGRELISSLWRKKVKYFETVDGVEELRKKFIFTKKRMFPVESFLDNNILLEDQ